MKAPRDQTHRATQCNVADFFLVRISILYTDMNLTIISSIGIVPHNLIRQVQKIIPHEDQIYISSFSYLILVTGEVHKYREVVILE